MKKLWQKIKWWYYLKFGKRFISVDLATKDGDCSCKVEWIKIGDTFVVKDIKYK